GISFAENLNPLEAVPDERGAVKALVFKREGQAGDREGLRAEGSGSEPRAEGARLVTLPARTVLVAAGTTPNVTYAKEAPNTFRLDAKKKFFQPYRAERNGDGTFHLTP